MGEGDLRLGDRDLRGDLEIDLRLFGEKLRERDLDLDLDLDLLSDNDWGARAICSEEPMSQLPFLDNAFSASFGLLKAILADLLAVSTIIFEMGPTAEK